MDERQTLLACLRAQREAVVAVVSGLSSPDMDRSVVPSGWTPASMVMHLAGAEWYWFAHLLDGSPAPPDRDPDPVASYLEQSEVSDRVLARLSLEAVPQVDVPPEHVELARSARTVVLHMIEETARHAGHLDVARELLDGATGLGPR
jgi:Protein of unknown function (DUF664)